MAQGVKVFGIPNCDTVKKARLWLTQRGLAHDFHDFKKAGVAAELLSDWVDAVGWERLLNRKGTTWRQLKPADQALLEQPSAEAFALIQANVSVIKRPVIQWSQGRLTVGLDLAAFEVKATGG